MSGDPPLTSVKTVLNQGGGPPPGYAWTVSVLDAAHKEALKLLDGDQYAHIAAQVRDLARDAEPTQCETVDVRGVGDFYEIRDKGGVLKRLNVRVFFSVQKSRRLLVILGVINKTTDGATPVVSKLLMEYRLRKFLASGN